MNCVILTLVLAVGACAGAHAQIPGESLPTAETDRGKPEGSTHDAKPETDTLVANRRSVILMEIGAPASGPRPVEFPQFGPSASSASIATIIEPSRKREFRLAPATGQSFNFLLMQTAARIAFQKKTRDKLDGPFLRDYARAATRVGGFGDGDSWFTNFVGHPVEGATAYHIARLNGASRTGGFWWSAAYSTQFELGPWSEASIGNVGVSPVDLVVTPIVGTMLGMTEEWLRTRVDGIENPGLRFLGRAALVGRTLAFLASGR